MPTAASAPRPSCTRYFSGINAKQREEVLENLPDATGVEKALGELFDLNEWIGITIDLATPILTAARDGRGDCRSCDDRRAAPGHPCRREHTRRRLSAASPRWRAATTKRRSSSSRTCCNEKLTQPGGTNLKELTEAVDGVYSFADERRAGMIAQTESYRAANWANKEAWRQSGVVKTVQWYTAEDQRVCQFCAAMEAQGPIPIDDSFADSDDKIIGTDGGTYTADYGVVDAPPLHLLCRCYLRPDEISTD